LKIGKGVYRLSGEERDPGGQGSSRMRMAERKDTLYAGIAKEKERGESRRWIKKGRTPPP